MTAGEEVPRDPQNPPPEWEHPPAASDPPVGLTNEERNWSVAAHAGSFVAAWLALGLLAPLLVLLMKGNQSPFIRRHAVESLNFQINALVYIVVFTVLILVVIGLILLPLYGIFYAVFVILGSVKASRGEDFRYPLTIRFIS
jgi:uncharacterized protein